jgi:hypothetical protein
MVCRHIPAHFEHCIGQIPYELPGNAAMMVVNCEVKFLDDFDSYSI